MKTLASIVGNIENENARKNALLQVEQLKNYPLTEEQEKFVVGLCCIFEGAAILGWSFDLIEYHIRHSPITEEQRRSVECLLYWIAGGWNFENFKS